MKASNFHSLMPLSDEQFVGIKEICRDKLNGKVYHKIVISSQGNFILYKSEDDVGTIVNWQELCLYIIPMALGINNIIINVQSPMHLADFIIQEFTKSKNPETLNV